MGELKKEVCQVSYFRNIIFTRLTRRPGPSIRNCEEERRDEELHFSTVLSRLRIKTGGERKYGLVTITESSQSTTVECKENTELKEPLSRDDQFILCHLSSNPGRKR